MSKELTVKQGKKITPEQAKEVNKNEVALLVARPAQEEVEGQSHAEWVRCPYCGAVGVASVSNRHWHNVWCGSCGQMFAV